MTPVSHALLPVVLGQAWIPSHNRAPRPRFTLLVAACGVLPDLLSPHLTLDTRHTALSHTALAALLFAMAVTACARRWPATLTPRLTLLCIAAYAGHLACDAITGGIAPWLPYSPVVIGENLLPYWLWIVCDGALILYLYLIYRWLPLRRRLRAHSSPSSPGSPIA